MVEDTAYSLRELSNRINELNRLIFRTSSEHQSAQNGSSQRIEYSMKLHALIAELGVFEKKAEVALIKQIVSDVTAIIESLIKSPDKLRSAGEAIEAANKGIELLNNITKSKQYFSKSSIYARRIGIHARRGISAIRGEITKLKTIAKHHGTQLHHEQTKLKQRKRKAA